MRRKKHRKIANKELLDAIFESKKEWEYLQHLANNSFDVVYERELHIKLAEAKYIFLLKEAKRRNISVLRY